MIRYHLELGPTRDVVVSLDAEGPDDFATLRFEGHPADVETVKELVERSAGYDGKLIETVTTPLDLEVAMKGRWLSEVTRTASGS